MKIFLKVTLFSVIAAMLVLSITTPTMAQEGTPPTPTSSFLGTQNIESGYVPFYAMEGASDDPRSADIVLRGPFANADVRFTPPSYWQLQAPALLRLDLTAAFSDLELNSGRSAGANLDVIFNGITIASLFISNEGQQVYDIPVPAAALVTTRSDGRHIIEFSLDAAFDCLYPHETLIIISSASVVNLPHSIKPITADLTTLPRPFYQANSFLPENVFLVLPNEPTASQMQAALTVSAAFGRMSFGELDLTIVRVGELSDDLRTNSHLIFIGDSKEYNIFLSQVTFPNFEAVAGDGILQVAVSPWNQTRAIMRVSGVDEAGMIKAAQALTFGTIQPVNNDQTSIIRDVNPANKEQTVADVRSFAELGYPTRNINGFGLSSLEYRFYIPPGFVAGNDSKLSLVYGHSALLDFTNSGVVISLNDQPVSSFALSEETSRQLNTIDIPLYKNALHPGDNRLTIQLDILPENICSEFSNRGAWFTVHSDSLLNLPLLPAEPGASTAQVNLSLYPFPFNMDPSLGNVGIILSKDDPASWNTASKITSQLGRRASGQLITPRAAFVDSLDEEFLNNNLIIIGKPTNLPLLNQIADAMPAPFENGSNIATERGITISYRLPEEASLGYLELFQSPWNVDYMVLTILGSTPEGLGWAYNAITLSNLRGRVTGNFVVVNDTQILSTDTRTSNRIITPNAQPVSPANNTPVPTSVQQDQQATKLPGWVLPGIIIVSILTIGFVTYIASNSFRQSKMQ